MSGLGGLNKSPAGVVIGMVQLQLPTVTTPRELGAQADRIVALVGIVNFDGTPLATGGGRPDEIITSEVRPDLVREARRGWGVENNIYQLAHRGHVAVKGGASDCPYTFMQDLVGGRYRLPWEDEVVHVDGRSCGFAPPERTYGGPQPAEPSPASRRPRRCPDRRRTLRRWLLHCLGERRYAEQ
jgi:hypothetical protein